MFCVSLVLQNVVAAAGAAQSDESTENSEEEVRDVKSIFQIRAIIICQGNVLFNNQITRMSGFQRCADIYDFVFEWFQQQAPAEALVELKSVSTDTTSAPDTTSDNSQDSEDSDDDDDDDEAEETVSKNPFLRVKLRFHFRQKHSLMLFKLTATG